MTGAPTSSPSVMPTSTPSTGPEAASTRLVKPEPEKAALTCVPLSRIAFPVSLTTPSARRKASTSPPGSATPIRGFSRVPSPLGREGDSATVPPRRSPVSRIAAYRAHHRHHGYSRQALLHAKWFWSTRGGEWQDSSSPNDGPAGSRFQNRLQCSRGVRPPAFEGDDEAKATSPAVTAFPRRGDIAALRDPYCVEVDRCFAHVPMWTLAKVLWVHDMHALAGPKVETPGPDPEDDPSDEAASVCSFDTNTSVDFSDDSDSTLVDSESEWEASSAKDWASPTSARGWGSPTSEAGPSSSRDVSPLAWTMDVYLKSPRASSTSGLLNSSRRWDVLLDLSNSEKRPEKSPPIALKPLPVKAAAPPPPKRYSFTRGFLTGLKKSQRPSASSTFVVKDSFINPSHPAAG